MGNVWQWLCKEEHSPLSTEIDDDMICSSVVKCIERHIMSEKYTLVYEGAERWRFFQMDPETVGGVRLHISLPLLLVVSLH